MEIYQTYFARTNAEPGDANQKYVFLPTLRSLLTTAPEPDSEETDSEVDRLEKQGHKRIGLNAWEVNGPFKIPLLDDPESKEHSTATNSGDKTSETTQEKNK